MQILLRHVVQRPRNKDVWFGTMSRHLLWVLMFAITALWFRPSPVYSVEHAQNSKGTDSVAIGLVLHTLKKRYKFGEPVVVLGYLENQGDRSCYVGNTIFGFFGTSELHEMKLRVFDTRGKEVWIGRGGGSWVWKAGTDIEKKLALAYTQLRPGAIFGVKEDIPVKLKPGRYRLVATYREIEALSWTEAERKALPIPVWTRPLTSNTVTIAVRP